MVVGDLKKMWFSSIRRIGNAKNLINLTPFNWLKIVSDEYVMTRYDSVGMTRWLEILLCLTAKLAREKAFNIIIWISSFIFADVAQQIRRSLVCQRSGARLPAVEFFGRVVWIVILYFFFFPIDWFHFIYKVAPLQLRELLR